MRSNIKLELPELEATKRFRSSSFAMGVQLVEVWRWDFGYLLWDKFISLECLR